MNSPWAVKDTPCFPARWKVYPRHTYGEQNDTGYYFRNYEDAQQLADKYNKDYLRDVVELADTA